MIALTFKEICSQGLNITVKLSVGNLVFLVIMIKEIIKCTNTKYNDL
jgi:hypothetical protein